MQQIILTRPEVGIYVQHLLFFKFIHHRRIIVELHYDIKNWLDENVQQKRYWFSKKNWKIESDGYRIGATLTFMNDTDAIAFKLRWM